MRQVGNRIRCSKFDVMTWAPWKKPNQSAKSVRRRESFPRREGSKERSAGSIAARQYYVAIKSPEFGASDERASERASVGCSPARSMTDANPTNQTARQAASYE